MEKEESLSSLINKIPLRVLTVIVFSLYFSWLLAFPFEGQILYSLADFYKISIDLLIFETIAVHCAGLFLWGFFIKNRQNAKKQMLITIVYCIIATFAFYFEPSFIWYAALISASFLGGGAVACWGYYLKSCTPKNERIKTTADGLIYSNIIMIFLNMTAIHISPRIGLGFSMLVLAAAFFFTLKLPGKEEIIQGSAVRSNVHNYSAIRKPLLFLCLFVVIITIDSGLMYQVQGPAFSHLEWLASWYWAVPYIIALFIMRNIPRKINRTYILFAAIAMIGFSYIFFTILDRSASSYLVVDTLMLGACGVFDLFWWSILGEMLDYDKNPAHVLGMGLAANVLGVLLGGMVGNAIGDGPNSSLLALSVVCITLVMLPPLHRHLTYILNDHAYLTVLSDMPQEDRNRVMEHFIQEGQLSARESEITQLLLKGKTYKAIAAELFVSENTIKTHVKNIYGKYQVQSRSELVNLLLERDSSIFNRN